MNQNRAEGDSREVRFVLMFSSRKGERLAHTVIESLRTFGGRLRHCPVWAFVRDSDRVSSALPDLEGIRRLPLALADGCPPYPFVEKVYACAQAAEMAGPEVHSLVWLSLDCLIINPPRLFDLSPSPDAGSADIALRPVHHRNIGSPALDPLDAFWEGVYGALGVVEMPHTVESFADGQTLRPYFNTHCFAFNPATGLAQAWWAHFEAMVMDEAFQAGPCRDELHQIFLHQAILSTLVARRLDWERVRLLPPEYNYPLNLLQEIPKERRPATLNRLVNAVYEDAFPWGEIGVEEPLRSWLRERFPPGD